MNLQLSLKRKFFEMTDPNRKTEDYRLPTPYWYSILCRYDGKKMSRKFWEFAPINTLNFDIDKVSFAEFEQNIMTLGYPSKEQKHRFKIYEHAGIELRTGNTEWGAEPNKLYFVIKHGKQL